MISDANTFRQGKDVTSKVFLFSDKRLSFTLAYLVTSYSSQWNPKGTKRRFVCPKPIIVCLTWMLVFRIVFSCHADCDIALLASIRDLQLEIVAVLTQRANGLRDAEVFRMFTSTGVAQRRTLTHHARQAPPCQSGRNKGASIRFLSVGACHVAVVDAVRRPYRVQVNSDCLSVAVHSYRRVEAVTRTANHAMTNLHAIPSEEHLSNDRDEFV